jgi:hypothetical protein
VKTASGATAVQIVEKRHGVRRILEHVGSAHSDAELAVLLADARERLNVGQQALDLNLDEADGAAAGQTDDTTGLVDAVVVGSASEVLWEVLTDAYRRLGFDTIGDEAFRALVLARVIEPTSKLAAIGVLDEIGVPAPHRNTFAAALKRCIARDYRNTLATACMRHSASTAAGRLSLVLYDCTVRHEALVVRVGVRDPHRGACRSTGP